MATLRELMIEIGIDADSSGLKKMERGLQDVIGAAKAVGVALLGAGAALFGLAKSTANYADTIQDTAMAVGLTNAELQTLGHAAKLSGSSLEEAADSMRFLSRNMQQATSGTGPAAEAFQRLGVRVRDANGNMRGTNDVFTELASRMASLPNGAEKTAMAMDLFGRSGAKLIPLMNAGAGGIAAMRQEAYDLGIVLDDASIQAGSEFNDAVDRLTATFGGLKNSIGAAVIPALIDLVNQFRTLLVANLDVIKAGFGKFLQGTVTTIRYVTMYLGFMATGFGKVAGMLGGVVPLLKTFSFLMMSIIAGKLAMGIYSLATGFLAVARGIKIMNLSAMLIPALIGAAVLGVALIIEDVIAYFQGRPSFLGYLLKNKDQILAKIRETVTAILTWIDEMFVALFDFMEKGIAAFFEFFGVPTEQAKLAANNIVSAFRWAYGAIKDGLVATKDFIVSTFNFVLQGVKPIIAKLVEIINEPMLFFTRMPELVKDVFQLAFGVVTKFLEFAISSLMKMIGIPQSAIDVVISYMTSAFERVGTAIGDVMAFVTGLITDGIAAMFIHVQETIGLIATGINFLGGLFGGGGQPNTQDRTTGAVAQGVQNNVSNSSASANTTISPTINVSVSGGASAATADDIARKIRDEIAGVAQGVGRSVQPQFAQ
jgi:phage-related protein